MKRPSAETDAERNKALRDGLSDTLDIVDASMQVRMEALRKLKAGGRVDNWEATASDLANVRGTESCDLIEVTPRTTPDAKNSASKPAKMGRGRSDLSETTSASSSTRLKAVVIELGEEGEPDVFCLDESDDEDEIVFTEEHPSLPSSASLAAQAPALDRVSPALSSKELPQLPAAAQGVKRRAETALAPPSRAPRLTGAQSNTFVVPMPDAQSSQTFVVPMPNQQAAVPNLQPAVPYGHQHYYQHQNVHQNVVQHAHQYQPQPPPPLHLARGAQYRGR